MIRISIPWVVDTFTSIGLVRGLSHDDPSGRMWTAVSTAKNSLETVMMDSIYSPYLRASAVEAETLHKALRECEEKLLADAGATLDPFDLGGVQFEVNKFLSVFKSEMNVAPSFLVAPKEAFDVSILSENGAVLFPPALLKVVPAAKADANAAGRALAFELPTACGFHSFRVLEAVLKAYWDDVSGGKKRPEPQTIGKFGAELKKADFGDEALAETLQGIAKHHRNPLIHPEAELSTEEAIGIVGICRSAISVMLKQMA